MQVKDICVSEITAYCSGICIQSLLNIEINAIIQIKLNILRLFIWKHLHIDDSDTQAKVLVEIRYKK